MAGNTELIEELRGRLNRVRADQEAVLATVASAHVELAALAATVTSPDGAVTVVAGPGGIVRSVSLAGDPGLSATVEATIRQAVAEVARRQLEIVRERLGDHVDAAQVLGPQAMFLEPAPPAAPEIGDEIDDDADDGPSTILAVR